MIFELKVVSVQVLVFFFFLWNSFTTTDKCNWPNFPWKSFFLHNFLPMLIPLCNSSGSRSSAELWERWMEGCWCGVDSHELPIISAWFVYSVCNFSNHKDVYVGSGFSSSSHTHLYAEHVCYLLWALCNSSVGEKVAGERERAGEREVFRASQQGSAISTPAAFSLSQLHLCSICQTAVAFLFG